jgi:GGDEF domain-containing protein
LIGDQVTPLRLGRLRHAGRSWSRPGTFQDGSTGRLRGHDEKLPITVSIGQASVRQDDSAESLLNRADQALYASKAGGRNRFSIADEE